MITEEDFESMQLLRNSLDVIETINTHHELHALEFLLELCYPFLDLFLFETFLKLLGVNANWESTTRDDLALELYPIRSGCQAPEGIC